MTTQITPVRISILEDFSLDTCRQRSLLPHMNQQGFMELSDSLQSAMRAKLTPERAAQHKRNLWIYNAVHPVVLLIFLVLALFLFFFPKKRNGEDIVPHVVWTVISFVMLFLILVVRYISRVVGSAIHAYMSEQEELAEPVLQEMTRRYRGKPGELFSFSNWWNAVTAKQTPQLRF